MSRAGDGSWMVTPPPGTWRFKGTCGQDTPEARGLNFFTGDQQERYKCRAVCAACPVRRDCITYALETRQIYGIWGGVDEYEVRRALGVDANGSPCDRARRPRCPLCKERNLAPTEDGHMLCPSCGLSWTAVSAPQRRAAREARVGVTVAVGVTPRTA